MAGIPLPGVSAEGQRKKPAGPVRLCYNENPHGPSPRAIEAMSEQLSRGNLYALDMQQQLRHAIAQPLGLSGGNVVLGSGSSEVLGLATGLAAKNGPGQILLANPSFTMWLSPAGQLGLETRGIELDSESRHDLGAMLGALSEQTRMVYLCNPANPCGTTLAEEDLRKFIREAATRTLVVVDEAYFEYPASGSVVEMVKDLPNLIVTRTFSKIYGLAGLRVGYGVAHPETTQKLAAREGWPNICVSNVSMAAALASLQDTGFVHETRQKNRQAMEFTTDLFKELKLNFIPSKTSFVLFDVNHLKLDISDALGKRGVQVRNWGLKGKRYCRVSMGTMKDMGIFAEQLRAVLKG